jgi:hypothetical protein
LHSHDVRPRRRDAAEVAQHRATDSRILIKDAGGRHDVQLGDIDKAIRHGFGFRYAVLGLLEFIDWGGGDILYYASRYFESALGSDRYRSPEVISNNPRDGRIGMTGAASSTIPASISTPIATGALRQSLPAQAFSS